MKKKHLNEIINNLKNKNVIETDEDFIFKTLKNRKNITKNEILKVLKSKIWYDFDEELGYQIKPCDLYGFWVDVVLYSKWINNTSSTVWCEINLSSNMKPIVVKEFKYLHEIIGYTYNYKSVDINIGKNDKICVIFNDNNINIYHIYFQL